MLSDIAYQAAIDAGDLDVSYAFLPGDGDQFRHLTRPAHVREDPEAQRFFQRNLTRSRLALTLGPLVKPLLRLGHVPKAQRYADHSQVVDLRRSGRGWVLPPGQSAIVFTNEYVRLSHDLVGIILGRVSSYHTGLVTATSFVDSTWDGLIELHLINTARRSVRLHIGMEIGRLFILEAEGGSRNGSSVSRQGLHFGYTWPRILADEIDPFPRGSTPKARSIVARLDSANDFLRRYAGYGLASLAVLATTAGVPLYGQIQEAVSAAAQARENDVQISALLARAPVTGTERVTVEPGETGAETRVGLPAGTPDPTTNSYTAALVRPAGSNATAHAEVRSAGGQLVLELVVELPEPSEMARELEVGWIYVP